MQKRALSSFIVFLIAIVLIISIAQAASSNDLIEQKTGIDPKNIKSDLQKAKEDYLKKNWGELIAKNKIIGPIHNFFTAISPVFKVLFALPYSLSLILLFVILLWLYTVTKIDSALYAGGFLNRPAQMIIAVAAGIILAQIKLFEFIALWVEEIIVAPEQWTMRIVIVLVCVIVAMVINYLTLLSIRLIKLRNTHGRDLQKQEILDEMKEFMQGLASGKKSVKK